MLFALCRCCDLISERLQMAICFSAENPRKNRFASLFGGKGDKKKSADRESGSKKKSKNSKGGGTGSKKIVPKKSLPRKSATKAKQSSSKSRNKSKTDIVCCAVCREIS